MGKKKGAGTLGSEEPIRGGTDLREEFVAAQI